MKQKFCLISILLLLLLSVGQGQAQTSGQNTILVERPWARATPAGARTGAVYVTLVNNGSSSDSLLNAATPVADQIQFHSASEENGVSRMREMRTVEVTPGARVAFSPGGLHIMLVGLKQPLKEGQAFPMTLTFEKAGKIDLMVPIAKVGAMQGGDMGSMDHGHDGPMRK
ncbi:MAG: copper chaperone PCu(A)C [Bradyrhizobium sp.]